MRIFDTKKLHFPTSVSKVEEEDLDESFKNEKLALSALESPKMNINKRDKSTPVIKKNKTKNLYPPPNGKSKSVSRISDLYISNENNSNIKLTSTLSVVITPLKQTKLDSFFRKKTLIEKKEEVSVKAQEDSAPLHPSADDSKVISPASSNYLSAKTSRRTSSNDTLLLEEEKKEEKTANDENDEEDGNFHSFNQNPDDTMHLETSKNINDSAKLEFLNVSTLNSSLNDQSVNNTTAVAATCDALLLPPPSTVPQHAPQLSTSILNSTGCSSTKVECCDSDEDSDDDDENNSFCSMANMSKDYISSNTEKLQEDMKASIHSPTSTSTLQTLAKSVSLPVIEKIPNQIYPTKPPPLPNDLQQTYYQQIVTKSPPQSSYYNSTIGYYQEPITTAVTTTYETMTTYQQQFPTTTPSYYNNSQDYYTPSQQQQQQQPQHAYYQNNYLNTSSYPQQSAYSYQQSNNNFLYNQYQQQQPSKSSPSSYNYQSYQQYQQNCSYNSYASPPAQSTTLEVSPKPVFYNQQQETSSGNNSMTYATLSTITTPALPLQAHQSYANFNNYSQQSLNTANLLPHYPSSIYGTSNMGSPTY